MAGFFYSSVSFLFFARHCVFDDPGFGCVSTAAEEIEIKGR
jgi:hypothetical protein